MDKSVNILMYMSCVIFFILGIATELMGYNNLSCWLISLMLLFVFIIFVPKLFRRFKKKNTKFINFLNFCALIFFTFIIAFLMANMLFFAIWGHMFWSNYLIVVYPSVLIYLLIEAYISFIVKEKYKYAEE